MHSSIFPMLSLCSLTKKFDNHPVLTNLSLRVKKGSLIGLIGPSAGGKSVLLKILGGVETPDSGTIKWDEGGGSPNPPTTSLMFQEGALFDSLSVFDNIAFPLVQGRVPVLTLRSPERDIVFQKTSEILARVGLTKAAWKVPGQLSGGMRRRVSLARALVSRPELLLLDDPTAGLDPIASSVIMKLIAELHQEYHPTAFIVSHDLRRLLPVVETIAALFNGRIIFHGTLPELKPSAAPQPEVRASAIPGAGAIPSRPTADGRTSQRDEGLEELSLLRAFIASRYDYTLPSAAPVYSQTHCTSRDAGRSQTANLPADLPPGSTIAPGNNTVPSSNTAHSDTGLPAAAGSISDRVTTTGTTSSDL